MKKLVITILLLLSMYQTALAQDKPMHPGLVNINKEAIIAFAKDIIAKKKPEINQADLMFQEITYNYEPNSKLGRQEGLTASFILKGSEQQMGGKITYKLMHVFIDTNGDVSKSDVSSGSGSKTIEYEGHKYSLFWYLLDKYNTIIYLLSLSLWIYALIVLYRLFHQSFILLFITTNILGFLYYILAKYMQSLEGLNLTAYASILYALGLTIEVVAIILSLRFIQKSKT
jgi:hypothetical protein